MQKFADTYEVHSKSTMRLSDNLFEACGEIASECARHYTKETQTLYAPHSSSSTKSSQKRIEQDLK